jgi:hypothetical protein
VAAEAEGRTETTDFLLELGGLGGLAPFLALSIYLLRRNPVRVQPRLIEREATGRGARAAYWKRHNRARP